MKLYRLTLPVIVLMLLSAFAPLRAQSQSADPGRGTTYEYKDLWLQPGAPWVMREMNDLGAAGWELVSIVQTSEVQCWAIFKRPVPPAVDSRQHALPPPPPSMRDAGSPSDP
jgi:hypothetical protein